MLVTVNCSLGEVIDKITILDIKCEEIKDAQKNADCIKERDMLVQSISHVYNDTLAYYRSICRHINKQIWDDQEVVRMITDDQEYGKLARKVVADNDSRFRVKRIINASFESSLKEQKSYLHKRCAVLVHHGLGDLINASAGVRCLSTKYDQVDVVSPKKHANNTKALYADNPFINVIEVENYDHARDLANSLESNGVTVLRTGCFNPNNNEDVPYSFYTGMKLEQGYDEITKSKLWFFCRDTCDSALLDHIKKYRILLLHKTTSNVTCHELKTFVQDYITNPEWIVIDTDENAYSSCQEPHFSLAQNFVMQPITYYINLIKHTQKFYLVDSYLFCLCLQIATPLADEKCVFPRSQRDLLPIHIQLFKTHGWKSLI